MSIRGTVNASILSNKKYYEVPGAPQSGVGRQGESFEHVLINNAGGEARDIDTRHLTSQSTTPANRHNGAVE